MPKMLMSVMARRWNGRRAGIRATSADQRVVVHRAARERMSFPGEAVLAGSGEIDMHGRLLDALRLSRILGPCLRDLAGLAPGIGEARG